ncbi:helix-turn-helix domain-containing protein [Nonomuraea sp. NPDC059194]|uniref:helix-turn-helix domain-containing protein n=1 Tax=Nonomuraea sp. NPDC059194 TaxID=3346764 RepID=UPI003685E4D6
MTLTVEEARERLGIGRSTLLRMLSSGTLTGTKTHACGTPCGTPDTCKQGTWALDEEAVEARLQAGKQAS